MTNLQKQISIHLRIFELSKKLPLQLEGHGCGMQTTAQVRKRGCKKQCVHMGGETGDIAEFEYHIVRASAVEPVWTLYFADVIDLTSHMQNIKIRTCFTHSKSANSDDIAGKNPSISHASLLNITNTYPCRKTNPSRCLDHGHSGCRCLCCHIPPRLAGWCSCSYRRTCWGYS